LHRVEQLLFLLFADSPVAAPLVFRDDSQPAPMERGRAEEIAPNRPIADVPESS